MAKSNNQKAKILFLERMLRETGENHTVSMQEILDCLSAHGIMAERKSVYDDMDALRSFGMDVRFRRGRPGGYYLAGQSESAAELSDEMKGTDTGISAESDAAVDNGSMVNIETSSGSASDAPVFIRNDSMSEKKMKLIYTTDREAEVHRFFGDTADYTAREDGMSMAVSPILADAQFYGWLTAMGTSVKIAKPRKVAQAYREYLKSLAREYKGI